MRVVPILIVFLSLMTPWSTDPAAGQEAEVGRAVSQTLAAWKSGDFERFATFYHADSRGFFLDGGALLDGFNLAALEAAYNSGFRADLALGEMSVRVRGDVAFTVALLRGELTMPGGIVMGGSWRYSEVRVLEDGIWKVVQYHFSELQDGGPPR